MATQDAALGQGLHDTRAALARWRDEHWRVVDQWLGWSFLVAVGLLLAVYLVALVSEPGPARALTPAITGHADIGDVGAILTRNLAVLALHALACVAGFIAGSSLPREARRYSGAKRRVHELAGPFAIAFVAAATVFSLVVQAFTLGGAASTLAADLGLAPGVLMVAILPHALPELTVLFLPLAAWVVASRHAEWRTLLAATAVTVTIAVPVLVLTAVLETSVTPRLLEALAG